VVAVSGSAAAQTKNTEFYHVFDLKTSASKFDLAKAAEQAIKWNISDATTNMPIVQGPPPREPGSFKLVDPLANSPLAASPLAGLLSMAMAQQGGSGLKIVQCDGAVWTAKFERHITDSQTMDMTTCLFPYENESGAGYRLTLYGNDTAHQGGGIGLRLARSVVNRAIGDGAAWRKRMITSLVANVEKTAGSPAVYLEGQPALDDPRWPMGGVRPADVSPAAAALPAPAAPPPVEAPVGAAATPSGG
jgi:hypothetical protein